MTVNLAAVAEQLRGAEYPPGLLSMERAVLATPLIRPDLMKRATLQPDDFLDSSHREIWGAYRELSRAGDKITPFTVAARLGPVLGHDGANYLARLADECATLTGFESYVEGIRQFSHRRKIAEAMRAALAATESMDKPVDEVAARAIADVQKVMGGSIRRGASKREVAGSIVRALDAPLPCYSTGLPTLDEVMGGGLFAGKLYGIASRKKVGKTILLGSISHNLNAAGVKHLFIALEMSPAEIEQRNAARDLGINSIRFLKRDDSGLARRVSDYAGGVNDATIYEGAPGAILDDVRGMIARAVATHGIRGVILDYLQLVGGKSAKDTEEFHLRNIAQTLADIARREGLFVLIAAQVNQDGNTRGGEGLKLACDQYFTLHREKDAKDAWLEMEESRYTLYANVGSENVPGLWLDGHGPHFTETPP